MSGRERDDAITDGSAWRGDDDNVDNENEKEDECEESRRSFGSKMSLGCDNRGGQNTLDNSGSITVFRAALASTVRLIPLQRFKNSKTQKESLCVDYIVIDCGSTPHVPLLPVTSPCYSKPNHVRTCRKVMKPKKPHAAQMLGLVATGMHDQNNCCKPQMVEDTVSS